MEQNLATYNRVPVLEKKPYTNLFTSCYLILFFLAFISLGTSWVGSPIWPNAMAIGFFSLLLCLFLYLIARRIQQRCRYCGGPLNPIVRPFLLSPKFLAMNGYKQGNAFFTYKNSKLLPMQKQWTKITIQSLACHHCRLTEVKHTEHQQPASQDEINSLNDR